MKLKAKLTQMARQKLDRANRLRNRLRRFRGHLSKTKIGFSENGLSKNMELQHHGSTLW